ncbi:protein HIR1 [Cryptococcus gattii E566]|uniref:Protein HIR n=2 Tax=Cryptococcus gattii TaxID=37769 RepID=E6RBD0_CRYGW|nr:Transcription corepressor, putative [Cryptococcus gattii WM276]ADV24167.1 Transcription corepressor, putative [Cryptococcus gattii WM276]KIR81212.1 protein HIR1 [Cryptococcus gattii EJB2]KIY34842.1 protein HIR1 [Cryptococcus gattii E566]
MKVTKPNWVEHTVGEKKAKTAIYSISVHPDGTRLATGGLDHKVKIWSTLPILDVEAEKEEENPKLLCTMSSHTGSVLSVRWAHHGRFLATGSDDQVIMIWGLDPDGGGRLWGSDEVNVENWKALTRLVGHVADVVDLAWSRDDTMLASVGLDSTVWIWDGLTFERLRKLDLHQGFVKGVCWDPVGNYLATQSDDKTVKIWNTEDWSLAETISKPFETSPQSTFFRRLSWSPDGAFIAASNAMNGPVFVAAVIDREGWASDISFVGHENTIQVAAFNPRLFFPEGEPKGRATASSMLALGANDFSISIWRNTLYKPLVVLKDIFGADLMDLCWSNDGYVLYGSSVDGSMCAIQFEPSEFTDLADFSATELVLREYDYKPKRAHQPLAVHSSVPSITNGFGPSTTTSTHVNVLQPKKGKAKRRVDLSNGNASAGPSGGPSRQSLRPPPPADPFSGPIQGFASPSTAQASTARMFEDAHRAFGSSSAGTVSNSPRTGDKRKASGSYEDPTRGLRGRGMPLQQPAQLSEVQIIRARMVAPSSSGTGSSVADLPHPQVQSILRTQPIGNGSRGIYLEARNTSHPDEKNVLGYFTADEQRWMDYLPKAALAVTITKQFCAVACEDGSLRVYSPAGRLILNMKLSGLVYDLKGEGKMLLIITTDCQVRMLNTRSGKAFFPPSSIHHLLFPGSSSSHSFDIISCTLQPNGVPIIITSEPHAFAYDASLHEWTTIASPPIAGVQPLPSGPSGPLSVVDQIIAQSSPLMTSEKSNAPWLEESYVMSQFEIKLRATVLLDSKEEHKHWLAGYMKYLGDENFAERAEEVMRDLIGPVHHQLKPTGWDPKLLGVDKRKIAAEALYVLSKTIQGKNVASVWYDVLDKIKAEEGFW